MKHFIGMLLGESADAAYDPSKYATTPQPVVRAALPSKPDPREPQVYAARAPVPQPLPGPSSRGQPEPAAPPPPPPRRSDPPVPANQMLYGSSGGDLQNNANAQQEAVPLGCWLVSQPGVAWPVRQELKADTLPLQARVQIAAASAAPLGNGAAALYDNETFMSPLAASQPVVATGSLINTYTGEVVDLFEDAMPPPDNGRDAGDAERERKQAQRRLMAAEGNVNASHRKREQQNPIQPGDAGVISQVASYRVSEDVATEWNERANRDLYFNRNELAPTELEMTRNPFGFEGYNNRLRVNPYLLPTQDLDDKQWAPNATLLPGGDHRPKNVKPRLKKDRPRTDYVGQIGGAQLSGEGQTKPSVRRSAASRDKEGQVQATRGVDASQALYGDAPVADVAELSAPRALRGKRAEVAPLLGVQSTSAGTAASTVTAASVLSSLGHRGVRADEQSRGAPLAPVEAGAATATAAAMQQGLQRPERAPVAPGLAALPLGPDLVGAHGQQPRARGTTMELPVHPTRNVADERGAALVAAQRQALGEHDAREHDFRYVSEAAHGEAAVVTQGQELGAQDSWRREEGLMGLASAGVQGEALVALQGQRVGRDDGLAGAEHPRGPAQPTTSSAKVSSAQATASQRRLPEEQDYRAANHDPDRGFAVAAASATQASQEPAKRQLDRRGQAEVAQAKHVASGAHGAFGSLSFKARSEARSLDERTALAHSAAGFAERNSIVTTSNARGDRLSHRQDNFKVGGETDYQLRAANGTREVRPELQTRPYVAASSEAVGQRSLYAGAREARRPRLAKSPIKAHRLRERSGLAGQLQEPLESRYDDEA